MGIAKSFLFTILFPIVTAFSICHFLPFVLDWTNSDNWKKFAPYYEFSRRKLAQFAARKDEYDMIFFGASLTYSGINPEVFDQTSAQLGIENRSFNFAAPPQAVADAFLLTKIILDLKPKHLKWVVLDINTGFAETRFRQKGASWHTFEETAFFSQHIFASEDSLLDRLILVGNQWFEFVSQNTNTGRASEWLTYLTRNSIGAIGRDSKEFSDEIINTESQGYRPLDRSADAKIRRQFLEQGVHYLDKVPMIGREPKGNKFSSYKLAMFQRMKNLLSKSNIKLVLFVPSYLRHPYRNMEYFCLNGMFPMIDLRSPKKYPELYALKHRFDAEHLNEAGAAIQSQILATEFASHIKNNTFELRELASTQEPCDEKTSYLENVF